MRKKGYTLLSFILSIVVLFSFMTPMSKVQAEGINKTKFVNEYGLDLSASIWDDEKILNIASLDDDFTDDSISLLLTRRASLQFKVYTVNDFPEINLKEVEHVSWYSEENVKSQLMSTQEVNYEESRDTSWVVNIETYRQSLSLTLQEPSKENVLHAIKLLEQRDDVYGASPNFYSYIQQF